MKEDPYSTLAGLMREAAEPKGPMGPIHLLRGVVLSASPLRVDVAGTIQEADRFYISHRLVKEHWELLRLDCTDVEAQFLLSVACPHVENPHGTHQRDPSRASSGTLCTPHCVSTQAEPVLKPGDEVLLLTEDDQIFYLIDKVVKADEWDLSHGTAGDSGAGDRAASAVQGSGVGL